MGRTGRSSIWVAICALAFVAGWYVHTSRAVGPRLRVLSASAAPCPGGDPAPVVIRGQPLAVIADRFAANTVLELAITFADGRIFGAGSLGASDGSIAANAFVATTDATGEASMTLPSAASWPPGCYTVRVQSSDESAEARFALQGQPSAPAVVGRATLRVVNQSTQQPSGPQGTTAILVGSGFRSNDPVVVTIAAPDGAVLSGPTLQSDAVGRVALSYRFEEHNAPGTYDVVITGSNGVRANTQFKLRALPTTTQGNVLLRIVDPFPARIEQGQPFQLHGEQFAPNEVVQLIAVLPNGGRIPLATISSDATGAFQADATLGATLPTGVYLVLAESATSGARAVTRLSLHPIADTSLPTTPSTAEPAMPMLPAQPPIVAPSAPEPPIAAPSAPETPALPSFPEPSATPEPRVPPTNPLPTPPF